MSSTADDGAVQKLESLLARVQRNRRDRPAAASGAGPAGEAREAAAPAESPAAEGPRPERGRPRSTGPTPLELAVENQLTPSSAGEPQAPTAAVRPSAEMPPAESTPAPPEDDLALDVDIDADFGEVDGDAVSTEPRMQPAETGVEGPATERPPAEAGEAEAAPSTEPALSTAAPTAAPSDTARPTPETGASPSAPVAPAPAAGDVPERIDAAPVAAPSGPIARTVGEAPVTRAPTFGELLGRTLALRPR